MISILRKKVTAVSSLFRLIRRVLLSLFSVLRDVTNTPTEEPTVDKVVVATTVPANIEPKPVEEKMNALTYMKQYIDSEMTGSQPPSESLADLVTDREKEAMEETPFGRMNEMLGLLAGTGEEEDEDIQELKTMVRLTKNQVAILDATHKRFLFALFRSGLTELTEVYQQACSEEDFDKFMDDFPQA